jgi:two-component sensor histidine kinase
MVFRDVSEEYAARERIRHAMVTQAQLLKEVHHRVKNNLSVVSALLDLQAARITTKEQAVNALQQSRLRIHSMATERDHGTQFRIRFSARPRRLDIEAPPVEPPPVR